MAGGPAGVQATFVGPLEPPFYAIPVHKSREIFTLGNLFLVRPREAARSP